MSQRREYPDGPIPGVGAIVLRHREPIGAASASRPEVLLIRRGQEPMAGSWSLPGGAIELGETAADACVREVREECGLAVEVIAPVETVDIILRDDDGRVRFHYVIVDMLCRTITAEADIAATEGSPAESQGAPTQGAPTQDAPTMEPAAHDDASEAVWAGLHEVLEDGAFSLTARACTVIRKAFEQMSRRDEADRD